MDRILHDEAPGLKLVRYRFSFSGNQVLPGTPQLKAVMFEQFFGAKIWRGAIGAQLRRAVCSTQLPNCQQCPEVHSCAYPQYFEARPGDKQHLLSSVSTIPQPYLVSVDNYRVSTTRVELDLTLTLIGDSPVEYVREMLTAVLAAANGGIGKLRCKFDLRNIQYAQPACSWEALDPDIAELPRPANLPEPPDCPSKFHIHLLTPLRILKDKKLVTPGSFKFADLFSVVLRRVSSLSAYYGEPLKLSNEEFKALLHDCETVIRMMGDTLDLETRYRWSARQKKKLPLDGIVGDVAFTGDSLHRLWPYLYHGQWLHAGKSTTMGLGKYRLQV